MMITPGTRKAFNFRIGAIYEKWIWELEQRLEEKEHQVADLFNKLLAERDNVLYWVWMAGVDPATLK